MRVFLSYGHDEYSSLASRIKRDLERRDIEVWFDVDRLRTGDDWERYVEDGLDWISASADPRFVLLMTPHSVRRPNGFCLNELARAWHRNIPIFPVMVVAVEPPLSVARLQYLDMRDCVPVTEHEDAYQQRFSLLLAAIEQNRLEVEGLQARLLHYLNPLPPEPRDASFIGRAWVMTEIARWLGDTTRRVFWITGEAGVGKSALATWLSIHSPVVSAFHACRYGVSDRVDPRRVLPSLAYQLSTQLPDYRDRLSASDLASLRNEPNARSIFARLFIDPLAALGVPQQPLVMLIDALDEATHDGSNELASIIGTEFTKTPPWLRLIVTTRPYEQAINMHLQALDPWMLDAQREENLDDIRTYLRRELGAFTGNDNLAPQTIDTIVEKSEGLFLYVRWVREEVIARRLSLAQPDTFPQGLGGIYVSFFERYFSDRTQYETVFRPVLETVCAAREPLAMAYLADMFGWTPYQRFQIQDALGSLFPVANGGIRPFHQSVRDWITDPDRAGRYFIDVRDGSRRLVDAAWREYETDPDTMSEYAVSQLPLHLLEINDTTRLANLARDTRFLKAQETRHPSKPQLPLVTLESALHAMAAANDGVGIIEFVVALADRSSALRRESPLDALRSGNFERALGLVTLLRGTTAVLWGLLIAEELQDHGRSDQARATMATLLELDIQPLTSAGWEAIYAADLLAGLVDADRRRFDELRKQLFPEGFALLYDNLMARGREDAATEVARASGREYEYHGPVRRRARERLDAGDFDGAWKCLHFFPDRDESLVGLEFVRELARSGRLNESLQRIESFKPWNQAHALREIAELEAQTGRMTAATELLAAALDATEKVQDERYRITAYVALSQARIGDRAAARATFAKAREMARTRPKADGQAVEPWELADLAAQGGEFEMAIDLARQVKTPSLAAFAWNAIGLGLGRAGKVEAAFNLAADADAANRAALIEGIGVAQAEAGDVSGALGTARWIEGHLRHRFLHAITAALCNNGQPARAAEVASSIDDAATRDSAFVTVAAAETRAGAFKRALAAIGSIDNYVDRGVAMSDLAAAQASTGDFAAARELIDAIDPSVFNPSRQQSLRTIAAFQWQKGLHDDFRTTLASGLIDTLSAGSVRFSGHELQQLAARRSAAKDWNAALLIAQLIPDSDVSSRSAAFEQLGKSMAENNELLKAQQIASAIRDWRDRGPVLRFVASAQAEAGQYDEALQTARATDNAVEWALALQLIASRLACAGYDGKLKRSLADLAAAIQGAPEFLQVYVLSIVARLQGQIGDAAAKTTLERAARAAQHLNPAAQADIAENLAEAQLAVGRPDLAIQTMATAAPLLSAFTGSRLAVDLGKAGLTDVALQMFEERRESADRRHLQESLIDGLIAGDHFEAARRVAQESDYPRGDLVGAVVKGLASKRRFEEAERMARSLAPSDRDGALADVAEIQANFGLMAEAESLLLSIENAYYRACVMARIAVARAKAGDRAAAHETLEAALHNACAPESGGRVAGGFRAIVAAQLEIGDVDAALRTASHLDWTWERTETLAEVTVALARANRADQAVEIAKSIPDDRRRLLFRISAALAEGGHREAIKRLLPVAAENPVTAVDICFVVARLYGVPEARVLNLTTQLIRPTTATARSH